MKIVITGALGHIGSQLIRRIPARFRSAEVLMLDNLLTQRYCSLFGLPTGCGYKFIEADILKVDMVNHIKDADVVIHLAAITNAEKSFENKSEVEEVNYGGTLKVAEACAKTSCPMIFISSTSVYGTQKLLVDEACSMDDLKPQSPYAETKLKEEGLLKVMAKDSGLKYVIARFGTICGVAPGMRFHTAVNKFCWQVAMGEPVTVWKTALHQKRPYLALEDAIRAMFFIIDKKMFDGEVYNVLSGNHTVDDILSYIKDASGKLDVAYVDSKIMNQLSYEVSCEKFKAAGFAFEGSIRQCVFDTMSLLGKCLRP